jgi:hypothetical protein
VLVGVFGVRIAHVEARVSFLRLRFEMVISTFHHVTIGDGGKHPFGITAVVFQGYSIYSAEVRKCR